MKNKTSATVTLWVNRCILVLLAVLCIFLYDLLVWYRTLRQLPWQVCAAIMAGFYLCVPAILLALLSTEKLLKEYHKRKRLL